MERVWELKELPDLYQEDIEILKPYVKNELFRYELELAGICGMEVSGDC